ncbi:hypothetical protein CDEST_05857 [Colletotrichum destructivum]|uniref:Uncharacterized protein n=1 Tax=Colletotrichum destructivum TaxID=34406 RepID=A0AAX4ICX7_9PEZI|nr:hypothetical protein CDEST_05857 [Colletotrichum destructivum]
MLFLARTPSDKMYEVSERGLSKPGCPPLACRHSWGRGYVPGALPPPKASTSYGSVSVFSVHQLPSASQPPSVTLIVSPLRQTTVLPLAQSKPKPKSSSDYDLHPGRLIASLAPAPALCPIFDRDGQLTVCIATPSVLAGASASASHVSVSQHNFLIHAKPFFIILLSSFKGC